ncbi:MAG: hypothetical protein JXA42_18705 [Anaerolineales bacterium]|nr:hypothetical protein [Anaerolineales bacterium]
MEVKSPIANFIEVLKQVNQTAQTYGAKLRVNESATRAALIDPILKALGWDPTNPEMIEFEKSYIDTRVDYALLDNNGKVSAIVEAKALGGNLSDPKITTKLLSYGFTYGIQEIVLTDGVIWQHFSQSTPGHVIPESVDISKDHLITCADYFIKKLDAARFWMAGAPSAPSPAPAVVANPVVSIVAVPTPKADDFVPLDSLKADLHGKPSPKWLRLPDGNIIPIHYWRDILVECVKFVLGENLSIPVPLPDKAGKKISLLSHDKSDRKVTQVEMTYGGKTVHVHLNYDTNNCVANAIYILGYLPKGKTWQAVAVAS